MDMLSPNEIQNRIRQLDEERRNYLICYPYSCLRSPIYLFKILTNIEFLQERLEKTSDLGAIIADIGRLLRNSAESLGQERLSVIENLLFALEDSFDLISRNPTQLFAQTYSRLYSIKAMTPYLNSQIPLSPWIGPVVGKVEGTKDINLNLRPVVYKKLHANSITSCVVHSDLLYLVTGDMNGLIGVVDYQTAKTVKSFFSFPCEVVFLGLDNTNQHLVSVSKRGGICIFETENWTPVKEFQLDGYLISSCSMDDRGTRLIAGINQPYALVINLDTGGVLKLEGHSDLVSSCDISEDGNIGLTGSWDQSLRLWNLEEAKCERAFFTGKGAIKECQFWENESKIYSTNVKIETGLNDLLISDEEFIPVLFLEDGGKVQAKESAKGYIDSILNLAKEAGLEHPFQDEDKLYCWDIEKGILEDVFKLNSDDRIQKFRLLSNSGKVYLTTRKNRLINSSINLLPNSFDDSQSIETGAGIITSLAIMAEKRVVAIGTNTGILQVWNFTGIARSQNIIENSTYYIGDEQLPLYSFRFQKIDDSLVLYAASGNRFFAFNPTTGECLEDFYFSEMPIVSGVEYSLDSFYCVYRDLFSKNSINSVCIQQIHSLPKDPIHLDLYPKEITAFDAAKGSDLIVLCLGSKELMLIRTLPKLEVLATIKIPPTDKIKISDAGDFVVLLTKDSNLKIVETASKQICWETGQVTGKFEAVSISNSGKMGAVLVKKGRTYALLIWIKLSQVENELEFRELQLDDFFEPRIDIYYNTEFGKWMVLLFTKDYILKVFQLNNENELENICSIGLDGNIHELRIAPDGNHLITGDSNGYIRFWKIHSPKTS